MPTTRRIATFALTLLAAPALTIQTAAAVPTTNPGRAPASQARTRHAQPLLNGKIEVDPNCASEFPHWNKKHEFYDRPSLLCVRWINKTATAWARWTLYEDTTGPDKAIASGDVPAVTLSATSSRFDIHLDEYLPLHNGGNADKKYFVRVHSKLDTAQAQPQMASQATLVHKAKSGQPVKPKADPYACSGSAAHTRKVVLKVPKMTVNQTSSTNGDGDRDELYIRINQLGPGTNSSAKRLPTHPDDDDYYEAKNYATVQSNQWTNQDGDHVPNPILFSGNIAHGKTITLSMSAMEQDNADLSNIKNGLIDAMKEVAKVALETNNSYGAIVAAVASAIAGTAGAFIPNTAGHDFVGLLGVRLTNRCGIIQTSWVTFAEKQTAGGTLTNEFLNIDGDTSFESRLTAVDVPEPQSGFWPDGVDYGAYTLVHNHDTFWWRAAGTSNSLYTFLLDQTVTKP